MVECLPDLNLVFSSLSDPTRRDILKRVAKQEMNVGEIAEPYQLTFAAVAKHIQVLERAKLIRKSRRGKEQVITLAPQTLATASEYLQGYSGLWEARLDSLGTHLQGINKEKI